MAGVNVSREALTGVRRSLNRFKTEIADVPSSMMMNTSIVQSECERVIWEVKSQIEKLKREISDKEAKLRQLQDDLAHTRKLLEDTERAKKRTEQNMAGIEQEIGRCKGELSQLRTQCSSCDENGQDQCQQAVAMAESRLSTLNDHAAEAAAECREQDGMISGLNNEIQRIESGIKDTESELRSLEAELSKKETKWNNLKTAFNSLMSELNIFTNSVRCFTDCSLTQTQRDITSVDQCIQYIDDYLATNL